MGTHLAPPTHPQAFVVGPKFKGVKMIPPGAHFVSYRAVNVASGDVAPSCGFFVFMAARQVVVRTWQHATESLGEMEDPEEVSGQKPSTS